MNKSIIKAYAPEARKEYIRAVTARAHVLGFSASSSKKMQVSGDIASIGTMESGTFVAEQIFPASIEKAWREIERAIQSKGFEQVMEEIAFTWFNRFIALRYMELHDYLPCRTMILGNRVGNNSGVQRPAIMEELDDIDHDFIPKVDWQKIVELRLEGGRDEQIYRNLLIGQCNSLCAAMPLMFARLSHACELLLPDNLLHSGSLIQTLVQSIPAEEWDTVEIVGWLYQFYISEKKEEVIGKTVKSEDIPAATQLFTPNWIVQYMVQNTVGRQWLAHNPYSTLKGAMPYYIEPVEQDSPDLTPTAPTLLKPENITFLDPACGSGHILVEAYNVFQRMYQEKGYAPRKIPRLILEHNLFGLDIDERAAQLSQFALLMMAMQKDSRILENPPTMHIMAFQEWEDEELVEAPSTPDSYEAMPLFAATAKAAPTSRRQQLAQILLRPRGEQSSDQNALISIGADTPSPNAILVSQDELFALLDLFCHAKTFGSLLRVPASLKAALPRFTKLIEQASQCSVAEQNAAATLAPFVRQAAYLAKEYDCVVANPPYMGGKGMNAMLSAWAKSNYPYSKSDLCTMFIERCLELVKEQGTTGMITMQSWMFLSSFEKLRTALLTHHTLRSMAHLGARGFDSISGEVVSTTAFVCERGHSSNDNGDYVRLVESNSETEKKEAFLQAVQNPKCGWLYHAKASDFTKIPGSPVAYWVSEGIINLYDDAELIGSRAKKGLTTGNNNKFIQFWWEQDKEQISLFEGKKWFPTQKGGEFRKWYGNFENILNWENNGDEIKNFKFDNGQLRSVIRNESFFYKSGITWTDVSTGKISMRYVPEGFIFNASGPTIFSTDEFATLGLMNTKIINEISKVLSPTIHFEVGQIQNYPLLNAPNEVDRLVQQCISHARTDWDAYENSWDFTTLPLLRPEHHKTTLAETYTALRSHWQTMTDTMQSLEEENNQIFIDAYGLQDELTKDVPLKEITLTCNPYYRYGESAENISDDGKAKLENRLFEDSMKELLSYAIGCMMGRYSLDSEGLVYAGANNEGFDASKYPRFAADDDGIIPVTDIFWFDDDAARRFTSFMSKTWGKDNLEANMATVASALGSKANESPEATIRRYLSTKFYKDQHCKTYKKRPIYWLFSSGKYKAFECLVYMHRYTKATLSRMRANYVTPLQGKIANHIEYLENELENTTGKNALRKELTAMRHKQDELRAFDDLLRHHAEMLIELDLDDGVKKNYARFGGLLADVKAITGAKDE